MLRASVWFRRDPQMNGILESRLSNNKMTAFTVTTKHDNSFSFDFAAAAKILDIPSASLEAQYKQVKTQSRRFHVVFGDA
jgi:hypothetical protein